ncbi:hypothetical protein CCB80_02395 [Armatimonadetes bacterium Uphvl-Ar1]|nr:hypothetical protein CCB80_02395 [Armatimonadetes bacterium Uphvl-Ar1]
MPSTYHQLFYHLVFNTKLRQPYISLHLEEKLFAYTDGILKNQNATLIAINGMPDHVHLLLRITPSHKPADLIRELKKSTSNFLKSHIPQFAWQEGYGLFTVSRSETDKIKAYISKQKQHHQTHSTEAELAFLLDKE